MSPLLASTQPHKIVIEKAAWFSRQTLKRIWWKNEFKKINKSEEEDSIHKHLSLFSSKFISLNDNQMWNVNPHQKL